MLHAIPNRLHLPRIGRIAALSLALGLLVGAHSAIGMPTAQVAEDVCKGCGRKSLVEDEGSSKDLVLVNRISGAIVDRVTISLVITDGGGFSSTCNGLPSCGEKTCSQNVNIGITATNNTPGGGPISATMQGVTFGFYSGGDRVGDGESVGSADPIMATLEIASTCNEAEGTASISIAFDELQISGYELQWRDEGGGGSTPTAGPSGSITLKCKLCRPMPIDE